MREYLIYSDDDVKIYRVSRKLRKINNHWKNKIINLCIRKNGFSIQYVENSDTSRSFKKREEKYVLRNGRILQKSNRTNHCTYPTQTSLDSKYVMKKIYRILKKEFGIKFCHKYLFIENIAMYHSQIFKMHKKYNEPIDPHLQKVYFGHTSIKEAIRKYCGFYKKSMISKKHIFIRTDSCRRSKAAASNQAVLKNYDTYNISTLDGIKNLRGIIEKDSIDYDKIMFFSSPIWRIIAKDNPNLIKSIFSKNKQGDIGYARDVRSMYKQICDKLNVKTLSGTDYSAKYSNKVEEYHDFLSIAVRKLSTIPVTFKYKPELLDKFDNLKLAGYDVELALDSGTVIEWSTYMGNCLASYVGWAKDGNFILSLKDGDKIAYNIALDRFFNIVEMNSRYNNGCDQKLLEQVKGEINVLFRQNKNKGRRPEEQDSRNTERREVLTANV